VEQLARHVLAYRRDGEGLGVPFSLTAVSFYERCVEAEDTLREWIMEAGFKNVTVESIEEYCCAASVKPKKEARISIFLACGEKH